ncbi:unnamed protein product [Fraxinus pennsylvanica]|uniref:Uncharacterized protein n=1 Tax=Fraxinus pennsylvanica TaxID=56036 RepID=A0AAD1Z7V4_9LAMI|nr:unnamed protein product [Fraxinus pennsylvanica]
MRWRCIFHRVGLRLNKSAAKNAIERWSVVETWICEHENVVQILRGVVEEEFAEGCKGKRSVSSAAELAATTTNFLQLRRARSSLAPPFNAGRVGWRINGSG